MAADKRRPAKGKPGKKGLSGGRMPVKRSINLILIDEDRIKPWQAVIGIIIILALAAAFSKFLVMDRLVAMAQASARASRLQNQLDDARAKLSEFGEVETTYAHYTQDGMTNAELGLVDRTQIIDLIGEKLPSAIGFPKVILLKSRLETLYHLIMMPRDTPIPPDELQILILGLFKSVIPPDVTTSNWSVSANILTIDVTGPSLERLNELAQKMEESPIVDSCRITAATKSGNKDRVDDVSAKYIVYLRKAAPSENAEEVTAP